MRNIADETSIYSLVKPSEDKIETYVPSTEIISPSTEITSPSTEITSAVATTSQVIIQTDKADIKSTLGSSTELYTVEKVKRNIIYGTIKR